MNWSKEQARAIELRNKNILVAAAAGSGKTAVLVERIKRLILEEGCDIDRMLIVTFTNAAASEMKEKIENAIQKEIEENPQNADMLRKQLDLLPLANISTFHAFALDVIRRYFYIIDIDPSFKICDNIQQELLKEQALDELLQRYFEEASPEFFAFLDKYSGERNENRFRQTVRKTFEVVQSLPEPFEWLEGAVRELGADFESFASGKICGFIFDEARHSLAEARESIAYAKEKALSSGHEGFLEIASIYMRLAEELLEKAENRDFEGLRLALADAKMPTLAKKYFKPDESHTQEKLDEYKELLENARIPLKEAVSMLKKDYFYDSLENLHAQIRSTQADAEFFLKVMRDYDEIFAQLKARRGLVDFGDIEHFAYEILRDEEVCAYYREKFLYIFIDEYQDSNVLQEALISRISRANNIFMVGDVKQSIYKFRLAEPEIFQSKYRSFAEDMRRADENGEESLSEKIDLNRNFRSKKSVIDFINRIFARIMPGYDENAALNLGDSHGMECNFAPKLFLAETPWEEDSELDEELKNMIKAEKEALAAARIIKDSLGKTIFDSKKGISRPLQKGDIVILSRGIKNYGDIFYKILTDNNLPAYVDDNDGYFDTIEINVFVSLLAIIDNHKQDVPLLSVLRSEIFGFSIEDLARIRIFSDSCDFGDGTVRNKAKSYHDAFVNYAKNGVDNRLRDKCLQVIQKLSEWREAARVLPLEDLVWQLMLDTGFYIAMGAMPSGSRRQANLRALCDKALAYRKSQGGSLYGFMQYIDAVKQHKVSMGQVKMAAEGDDTIRIMTIHKSKGLEFPMVLLVGISKRLNYTKAGRDIAIHKDVGIGFPIVNYEKSWMKTSLIQNVIKARLHREETEEEKRILYVAMTRAKDILYLLGMTDNYNKQVEDVCKAAPGDSSYLSMCGRHALADPAARGYISNDRLRSLSEGTRRRAARGLALLDSPPGESGNENEEQQAAGKMYQRIEQVMSFEYPFAAELKIKSKYAVSELAQRHERDISLAEPKGFRSGAKLTAAQIGTITHKVLEQIDFAYFHAAMQAAEARADEMQTAELSAAEPSASELSIAEPHADELQNAQPCAAELQTAEPRASEPRASSSERAETEKYVASLICNMVKDEFLTEEEAEAIDREKIAEFMLSPLGRRMAAASAAAAAYGSAAAGKEGTAEAVGGSAGFLGLQRERPFNLVIEMGAVQPETAERPAAGPPPLAENTAAEGGRETEEQNLCGGYHSGAARQSAAHSRTDSAAGNSTGSAASGGEQDGASSDANKSTDSAAASRPDSAAGNSTSSAATGGEKGARSIVQGIIDCFFEEEGELVLVDYKTTNVRSKGEFAGRRESIRERYALQIDLYRRALEAATGKRVKEAYLYLTNIGETIEM